MAHDQLARLQYLESVDSVRSARQATEADAVVARAHRLQVFTEVLLTLALGRDIVVPQSYAFDSAALLDVAARALTLRDRVGGPSDHPFRLHVHGSSVRTFDDALSAALARTHDPERPFVSSLFPSLSAEDGDVVSAWPADLSRFVHWVDDTDPEIGAQLRVVRAEFSDMAPVRPRPTPVPTTADVLAAACAETTAATGADEAAVERRLARALVVLGAPDASLFAQRSRLRAATPWRSDGRGGSARELVGSDVDHDLVVEFVDTLYNRQVLASIGPVPATFSTHFAVDDARRAARAAAQRAALAGDAVSGAGSAAPRTDPPRGDADRPPLFDLLVPDAARSAAPVVGRELSALLARSDDVLAALLSERRGPRSGPGQSPFWKGVATLEERAGVGADAAQEALEAHLQHVGAVIGAGTRLRATQSFGAELVLESAGTALPGVASMALHLPSVVGLGVTIVGAVAPAVYQRVGAAVRQRRGVSRLGAALGELVVLRAGEDRQ